MRRVIAGVLAGLLVFALGFSAAPAPAAAASGPKIVLVVGATHGMTSTYRSWMNVVASTAAKYTRNLVKVYSPNATWSAVRAALQGASVVVYMGHGNGFPSPYSTTLNTYSQNGFGLNAAAGDGDSNTKYYGERYVANEVDLAPNALVILSHLCYASGNSEPGRAEPSLSVARARLDNFAAGFLRAGARAVIADGHDDPSWYLTQLFTTDRTIEQIWRSGPRPRGHTFSFASARTSGYTAFSDPDQKSGSTYTGFYRSLVTKPGLTSTQVVGSAWTRTDGTPASLVVPGAAEVTAPGGVGLFADAALTPADGGAPATLPAGTRLRLLAVAGTTPEGALIYEVATLDDSAHGFALGDGLAPRDSLGPRIWELDADGPAFSPNDDGSRDAVALAGRASEAVAWRVAVTDADGAAVASFAAAPGQELAASWNGLVDGRPVPDGRYSIMVTASDGWGNPAASANLAVVVDTVAPTIDLVSLSADAVPVFTPNGDGVTDAARFRFGADEAGTIAGTVKDAGGATVATFSGAMSAGAGSAAWDGRASSGAWAADGTYRVTLRPVDVAGNRGASATAEVLAYGALGYVARSAAAMHALDGDRFAAKVGLSYRLLRPANATWTLLGPDGTTLITRHDHLDLAAGSYGWTWNGKLPDGRWAAPGLYTSRVEATDGTTTVAQAVRFWVSAFRLTLSDTTPARGQSITATIVTTEPLRASPRLVVSQPGRSAVTLATTKVSSSTYKVTFRLATGGSAGTLGLRVNGTDTDGGYNWSRFAFPLE